MRLVHVVYFCWLDHRGNHLSILQEHMQLLRRSGLFTGIASASSLPNTLHVEFGGGNKTAADLALRVTTRVFADANVTWHPEMRYEYDGIRRVWDLAQNAAPSAHNDDELLLYLHSKGVSHGASMSQKVRHLTHQIVTSWRHVYSVFDSNPAVWTVGYAVAPGAFQWFNFWWARASFVRKVRSPVISSNRWYYEDWLGRFGQCVGWTDQCSPGGNTDINGRVVITQHPQKVYADERPDTCVVNDAERLSHMYSITDGRAGVAVSAGVVSARLKRNTENALITVRQRQQKFSQM